MIAVLLCDNSKGKNMGALKRAEQTRDREPHDLQPPPLLATSSSSWTDLPQLSPSPSTWSSFPSQSAFTSNFVATGSSRVFFTYVVSCCSLSVSRLVCVLMISSILQGI